MSCWEWAMHAFILAGLAAIAFNVTLNLRVFSRPARVDARVPGPLSVSVLIPARNEAARIGPCLESLRSQAGEGVEIIVLDDNSEDGTAGVVAGLGFVSGAGPLRLRRGDPLPEGWTGKSWACHQLAGEARGEWLLFTDADTVHGEQSVATLLAHARRRGASMLSAWPEQVMGSWGERLVIPLIGLLILGFLPQWLLALFQRFPALARPLGPAVGSLGAANGQCILFRADVYRAIGGHASVRAHLVEDVALARRVAGRTAEGLRLINCDGVGLVRCRMYEDWRGVWEGFTKNLRPAFEGSPLLFVASLSVQFAWMILPFFLLAFRPSWLAVVECAAVLGIRLALALRLGGSLWIGLVHPVAHLFALAIALNSWRQCVAGRVRWKGRSYRSST